MPTRETQALVVDASVATKWHLKDEEDGDQALSILDLFAEAELDPFAPDQIRYEVPSAITVVTLGSKPRITKEQGKEAIAEFLALGLNTVSDSDLILEAHPLVHRHGCALYDALYLALAQRLSIQIHYGRPKALPDTQHVPVCRLDRRLLSEKPS